MIGDHSRKAINEGAVSEPPKPKDGGKPSALIARSISMKQETGLVNNTNERNGVEIAEDGIRLKPKAKPRR
jgi:hypothetical protein